MNFRVSLYIECNVSTEMQGTFEGGMVQRHLLSKHKPISIIKYLCT
jgi:hypothetical protein